MLAAMTAYRARHGGASSSDSRSLSCR